VQEFKDESDVAFGDINLRDAPIRGNHNPGKGGWPTIRYFNQETGYDGAEYKKLTSKAMCDELGDQTYMRKYVKEYALLYDCQAATGDQCSEKESKFAHIWKEKDSAAVVSQIERLTKMKGNKMKPKLKEWINQRLSILKQLAKMQTGGGKDEL